MDLIAFVFHLLHNYVKYGFANFEFVVLAEPHS